MVKKRGKRAKSRSIHHKHPVHTRPSPQPQSKVGGWLIVILIVGLLVVLYFVDYFSDDNSQIISSEKDRLIGEIIAANNADDELAFIIHDQVDPQKLSAFANMNYDELKDELGMEKDFAIFFTDSEGAVIPIGEKICIGSPRAKVGGINCG
ncbi:MAG: hypothetical protein GY861_15765 [bacterium]|nr:hypothetical protein [bacterium]